MYHGVNAGLDVGRDPPQAVHVVVHDLQHHVLHLVTVRVQVAVGQVLRIVDVEQIAVVDIRIQRILAYVDLQGGGIIAFLARGEVIRGYVVVILRIVLVPHPTDRTIVSIHIFFFAQNSFGTIHTVRSRILFLSPLEPQRIVHYRMFFIFV